MSLALSCDYIGGHARGHVHVALAPIDTYMTVDAPRTRPISDVADNDPARGLFDVVLDRGCAVEDQVGIERYGIPQHRILRRRG